mmetsp:Transcript_41169/g.60956  ORF Transcript_41169/g.60956 Transcript_41169/m.60956 type:complete len:81 (-) Transcript_41169:27-269(-)
MRGTIVGRLSVDNWHGRGVPVRAAWSLPLDQNVGGSIRSIECHHRAFSMMNNIYLPLYRPLGEVDDIVCKYGGDSVGSNS